MKGKAAWRMILFLLLLLISLIALGAEIPDGESGPPASSVAENNQSAPQSATGPSQSTQTAAVFKILGEPTGEILAVDDKEFLYGTVVTEMSPESPIGTLKTQAVNAYTYYNRLRAQRRKEPDASLKGTDFSANISGWRLYTTKTKMQKRWGSKFDTYYQTLGKVADAAYGQTLQDDGQLIYATRYTISSGSTETVKDVWGGDYSYLVPIASPGDLYTNGYSTTVTLAPQQIQQASQKQWGISLSGDPSKWFGKAEQTASGFVTNRTFGDKTMKGDEVHTAFGLRSANYTTTYANDKFTFSIKGYGHGMSMSQTGTEYMAQRGSNYKQILEWYCPGAKLVSI